MYGEQEWNPGGKDRATGLVAAFDSQPDFLR